MPKMIVNHKVIITRSEKGAAKDAPEQRIVVRPARKGQPPVVFDFTATERDSILKAHPGAIRKLDQAVEVEAPAPQMQGGNQGQPGDQHDDADQKKTGDSVDGDKNPEGSGGIDEGDDL